MWVYVSTGFSLSFDRLHPSKNSELFSIFFFFSISWYFSDSDVCEKIKPTYGIQISFGYIILFLVKLERKDLLKDCLQISFLVLSDLNPLQPVVALLYPLKTSGNRFQGV